METFKPGTKVVIYARFSSHSQTEQSIEGQLADCHAFAERNRLIVVAEYIDRAISGKRDDRPDFLRMIRDSAKHEFVYVLVWKLDRFSRDRYHSAVYKHALRDNGVSVISVTEPISNDPTGIMLESMLEAYAEYYSAELSVKIQRGLRESRKKGWFPGGVIPYGYVHQDHHLVPDDRAVPVVLEIFDRYVAGEAVRSIQADLEARGIRLRNGSVMSFNCISKILVNPTYIGEYHHGGELVSGCATPIVNKDVFYMAVDRREKNRRAPAAHRKPDIHFLLLGKLYCGECMSLMRGDGGTSRHGTYHSYYTCSGKRTKKTNCKAHNIPKDDIEYAIYKVISDYVVNKKRRTIEIMANYIIEALDKENPTSESDALEARLKQLDRDMDKLIDSLMEMPVSVRPKIAKRMEDIENQRRDVSVKLSRKRLEEAARCTREDIYNFFMNNVLAIDSEQNRELIINKFLNAAYVYSDGKLVIYLNQFRGMPNVYREVNDIPDKDSFNKGTPIPTDHLPREISGLPDFESPPGKGSALYSYSPLLADKAEPRLPHLFFLHGRLGIVVWRQDLR